MNITPEMVAAGAEILLQHADACVGPYSAKHIVIEVYRAMREASDQPIAIYGLLEMITEIADADRRFNLVSISQESIPTESPPEKPTPSYPHDHAGWTS